jgi:hypothetical protein
VHSRSARWGRSPAVALPIFTACSQASTPPDRKARSPMVEGPVLIHVWTVDPAQEPRRPGEMSWSERGGELVRDFPLRALSLLTLRAAIPSARASGMPCSRSDCPMCSYWRPRLLSSRAPVGGMVLNSTVGFRYPLSTRRRRSPNGPPRTGRGRGPLHAVGRARAAAGAPFARALARWRRAEPASYRPSIAGSALRSP